MAPRAIRSEPTPLGPNAEFPFSQLLLLLIVSGVCVTSYRIFVDRIPWFNTVSEVSDNPVLAASTLFSYSFVVSFALLSARASTNRTQALDGFGNRAPAPHPSMKIALNLVSSWGAAVAAVLVNKVIEDHVTTLLPACFLVAAVSLLSENAVLLQIASRASPIAPSHYAE
jgi:hypothetical protein